MKIVEGLLKAITTLGFLLMIGFAFMPIITGTSPDVSKIIASMGIMLSAMVLWIIMIFVQHKRGA